MAEEEKKDKGLLIVSVPRSLHSKVGQYTDTRPSFALVSSPKEGRKQMTQLFTCRDFINDSMLSFYTSSHFGYNGENPVKLDTSKLRLMVAATGKVSDDEKKRKTLELAGFDILVWDYTTEQVDAFVTKRQDIFRKVR